MENQQGKKMGEQGKNSRESQPQKLFAKLPSNYLDLTPEEQAKWRRELAQKIVQLMKKPLC